MNLEAKLSLAFAIGIRLILPSSAIADEGCPDQQHPNIALGICADEVDATSDDFAIPPGANQPDLATLRGRPRATPVPLGIGAGVTYQAGQLKITSSADLQTYMDVHPNGIASSYSNQFIFTTATNRTDKTLEILAAYTDASNSSTPNAIDIYDWSCSPLYPCNRSLTSPSFVYVVSISDLQPTYVKQLDDGGGHTRYQIEYSNTSTYNPSTGKWTNSAKFWNFRFLRWDQVYSHVFGATQRDCSQDTSTCGWWGPIIETDLTVPIHEVGFRNSTLIHDGVSTQLGTSTTSWTPPSVWNTFFRNPNYTWGVGTDTNE